MRTPSGHIVSSSSAPHSMQSRLPNQLYTTIDEFKLESGAKLKDVTIAFTVSGRLNPLGTNAILICHALSGTADVADWWSSLFSRPRSALDLTKFCVICCNVLGSPYGSSSPLSIKPGSTSCYGSSFPKTTIRDDVRIQKHVMDILGVQSIYCIIGASMGGMVAMEWALHHGPRYVRSVVLISTAARQSPWAIAWAENQRSTIKSDSRWRGGCYGDDPPVAGLAAARMAAMLSYRTYSSFEKRFGRRQIDVKVLERGPCNGYRSGQIGTCTDVGDIEAEGNPSPVFLAQSYLWYQGEKFNRRFDANCYVHILDKIDTHDISRGRCPHLCPSEAMKEVLKGMKQRALVIGVASDGLYPIQEQMELSEHIPNAQFAWMESDDGHDGFLLEGEQMNNLLQLFFDRQPLVEEVPTCWKATRIPNISPGETNHCLETVQYAVETTDIMSYVGDW
ncbi:hypothetical protein AYL99_01783 [Fonsecaea erecta]|uniref:AB hydrolase-1 domain-containing protein n=1 Tax=Fonsecaea erecta TaxID=1367422 RepID=A0A178ZT14_9EURO|nr:hypothetical protein AYL99_01783 [Fonsecaea erecta]OAP62556.1 hypothetical protein AYL99_01783 [Fonsecaea erecta]